MDPQHVIDRYIETVLETGHPPVSVYAFAKSLEVGEREFYEHFPSLEALEGMTWAKTVHDTVAAVESGEEWASFSARQKLLTFLFAYSDRLLDHRSFFLVRFPRLSKGEPFKHPKLHEMRDAFVPFANSILEGGRETGEVACRGRLTSAYPDGLFGHLLSVIEFNLEDTSKGFERTDAFIEKTVRLAFDLIGTQAIDSAFDLVRFLTGRSWNRTESHPGDGHQEMESTSAGSHS
ncbi:MAG: TetR family transcriptional regulator C-terminal domain-containing protein [Verrucomicrobiota bacterium]